MLPEIQAKGGCYLNVFLLQHSDLCHESEIHLLHKFSTSNCDKPLTKSAQIEEQWNVVHDDGFPKQGENAPVYQPFHVVSSI